MVRQSVSLHHTKDLIYGWQLHSAQKRGMCLFPSYRYLPLIRRFDGSSPTDLCKDIFFSDG
ncbi:hypothetical protein JOD18_000640 [Gracilibacillus alcaliphilus]|nr:hypothetical protein [Gracilibacillus alcaliphilus]